MSSVGIESAPQSSSLGRVLKDTDVEELVDWWLHRPLAYLLIRPLENRLLFITPSLITILSMVLGVAAGACCYLAPTRGNHMLVIGGGLMFGSVVLDCADGQLARLRGGGTRLGMMLDLLADHVAGVSFWFGMCYAATHGWQGWWVWPANIVILVSVMTHVTLYDQFKNFYVDHVRARQVPDQKLDDEPGRFEKYMGAYYENAYPGLFLLVGGGGKSAEKLSPEAFRQTFAGPMRWVSFLGLGTHLALMYLVAVVQAWFPGTIFLLAQVIIVGLLNVVAILAVVRWRAADRRALASMG